MGHCCVGRQPNTTNLLTHPGRQVSKPRKISWHLNLGPIGYPETSVTCCITTQKSAQLEEALDRTLWRTRFGRGYVPFAKTDYAPNESSKISPLSGQVLFPPVHYLVRLDRSATSPSPPQSALLCTDCTDESTLHFQCWTYWAIIARRCAHTKQERFWSVKSYLPVRLMLFKRLF